MKYQHRLLQSLLVSTLVCAGTGVQAAVFTWDASGGSPLNDGGGTWSATGGTNWYDNTLLSYGPWGNTTADEAIFGAGLDPAGTVTVSGTVNANRISFNTPGSGNYTLSGGTLSLGGTSPTITANANATIGSVITGLAGLTKAGTGTLVLTGTNTYTGGNIVNAGILQLGNGTTNGSINGTYSIASGATLRLARAAKTTVTNGAITGAGTVSLFVNGTSNGSGTTFGWDTFTTFDNNFTGKLVVEEGRVSYTKAQLGGVSALEVQAGGQFMAWTTDTPDYNIPISIAGTGWGESSYEGGLRLAASGNGSATWSGPITLTADSGLMVQASSNFNVTGSIGGAFLCEFRAGSSSGNGGIINVAPASLTQNAYAATRIAGTAAGEVVAGNQYAFSTGSLTVNGAILKLNGFNHSFASLAGSGGKVGNYNATTPLTLTVGSGNTDTSASTVLENGGAATLALTKTGTGVQTLTGTSTYTGATSVNSGALLLNNGNINAGSAVGVANGATFGGRGSAGAVTVATGGTVQGGIANAGSLALASLTFSGNSTLNLMPVTGSTASVAVTGALTTAGTQTINIINSTPLAAGSYRLVSYGSVAGDGTGAFAIGTTPALGGSRPRVYALDTTPATYVGVNVSVDAPSWKGGVDGNWDSSTSNWVLASNGTTPTTYFNSDAVQFGDTTGNRSLVINGTNVTPASLVFNNSTGNDYSVTGTAGIGGTTSLVKNGTGSLTIANTNSYSGGTTINTGTVQLGNGTTNGVVTGNITNLGNLVFNNGSAQTYSGTISGANGTLTKSGSGVLTLSVSNSFSGATTISGGVVSVASLAANGTSSPIGTNASLTLDGGTLRYTGANHSSDSGAKFNRNLTVGAGGGTFDIAGSGFVFSSLTLLGSGKFSVIDSSGDANNRQLLYTGNSPAFTGSVDVGNGAANSGSVQYRSNAASPFGSAVITVHGGGIFSADSGTTTPATLANNVVLDGGTLATQVPNMTFTGTVTANTGTTSSVGWVSNGTGTVTLTNSLLGSGTISTIGGKGVFLSGDNSGFTGTFQATGSDTSFNSLSAGGASAKWMVNGSSLIANASGGGTVALGEISGTTGSLRNNITATTATFEVGALGTSSSFGGTIIDKAGDATSKTALTKVGGGILSVTGASTYTGPTTINGGTLAVQGSITSSVSAGTNGTAGTLGGYGTVTGNVDLGANGILRPGLNGTSDRSLTIAGNVTTSLGAVISFAVDGETSHDQLVVTGGTVDLTNAALQVTINDLSVDILPQGAGAGFLSNPAGSGASYYKLIEGNTGGTMFANVTTTMSAAELTYFGLAGTQFTTVLNDQKFWVAQGSTYLVAIPETSSSLLAGLGALGLAMRRRRK